jgi:hypothetical protein
MRKEALTYGSRVHEDEHVRCAGARHTFVLQTVEAGHAALAGLTAIPCTSTGECAVTPSRCRNNYKREVGPHLAPASAAHTHPERNPGWTRSGTPAARAEVPPTQSSRWRRHPPPAHTINGRSHMAIGGRGDAFAQRTLQLAISSETTESPLLTTTTTHRCVVRCVGAGC